jgi:hypothetical protein
MWCFIYVDFTDLLTVIEFTYDIEVIRHQTQHSRLHSLNMYKSYRSIARGVTKLALLMDPDKL